MEKVLSRREVIASLFTSIAVILFISKLGNKREGKKPELTYGIKIMATPKKDEDVA